MEKSDVLFIGLILAMLVTVSNYSLVAGSVYAFVLILLNLFDSKKTRGSK